MLATSKTTAAIEMRIEALQAKFVNAVKNNVRFSQSKKIWKELKALKEELKSLQ